MVGMGIANKGQYMATIIINKSLESKMLKGFEEELEENRKILAGRFTSPFNYQRAIERIRVVEESIIELKKQIAQPNRHALMKEGINPESEELYKAQVQQFNPPKYKYDVQA